MLNPFNSKDYPTLSRVIEMHDLYYSFDESKDEDSSKTPSPEMIPLDIQMLRPHAIKSQVTPQERTADADSPKLHPVSDKKSICQKMYEIFFCCWRKSSAIEQEPKHSVTLLRSVSSTIINTQTVALNPVEHHVISISYEAAPVSDVFRTHIVMQEKPQGLEIDYKVYFWRQNMIKDMCLPDLETCEYIISDKQFHELRILKSLLVKPENRNQFERLSPSSKEILDPVPLQNPSPIFELLRSTPSPKGRISSPVGFR